MSSCITSAFITSYFYTMMDRIAWDCVHAEIVDEIIQLFLLLLKKLRVNNRDRLSEIINMTDKVRDKKFYDFVYESYNDNDNEMDEYDPRNRIFVLYKSPERHDILKSAMDIVLYRIEHGETGREHYPREHLELYSELFYQFIEYLYLDKYNSGDESIFSYDESGKRIHILEGKISAGSKRTKKNKTKNKTKNKKNKTKNKNKNKK